MSFYTLSSNENIDSVFSEELKQLIADSRSVALEMGYDYISTLHFFIADCKSASTQSLKNFGFLGEEDFEAFVTKNTIAEPHILCVEDLPLTVEAEQTVRKAAELFRNKVYQLDKISIPHLFIAASVIEDSVFKQIFGQVANLEEHLEQHYCLRKREPELKPKNLFKRLFG